MRHQDHSSIKEIIYEDGSITKDPIRFIEEGISFFTILIGNNLVSQLDVVERLISNILGLLNDRINDKLSAKFSKVKVCATMFEMRGSKAPSLDGFLGSFLQIFWKIVKSEVVATV